MCSHGDTKVLDIGGKPVDVDRCLAGIVEALNVGGAATVASCCGHGHRPGNVALADGRELLVLATHEEGRRVDALLGVDIHGQ